MIIWKKSKRYNNNIEYLTLIINPKYIKLRKALREYLKSEYPNRTK